MNLQEHLKSLGLNVSLAYPMFVDQTQPKGWLTHDPACHALWYYYMLAMTARSQVGKSIEDQIIEYDFASGAAPPLWMDKRFNAQIKSIAGLYGVTVEQMQGFWSNIKLETRRLGMPDPADEIVNLSGEDYIT